MECHHCEISWTREEVHRVAARDLEGEAQHIGRGREDEQRTQDAGQKWKQVGIVSFGASAGCEVGYPAGLTRVEAYLDWICQETGEGCG